MELTGFDQFIGEFELVAPSGRVLQRSLVDFQTWDRYIHKLDKAFERLPMRRVKKLMSFSWSSRDFTAGKHRELKKNCSQLEQWIRKAFDHLPSKMQESFVDETLYTALKNEARTRLEANKTAKDLGQYFSPTTSINMLLDVVFALPIDVKNTLFLEPSCGIGNFFQPMIDRGVSRILGFELDPEVAKKASMINSAISVVQGNFLESSRQDNLTDDVIVIGNPPFSSSGPSDIVLDFFSHCAIEWKAKVIAFILPERCATDAYVETTRLVLGPVAYTCHHVAAIPDSHFDFKGTRINKPSSIVVFTRIQ
ncbi:hypothetical protein LEN26_019763 [Aphanomyces euteiches]|nr:hypothetical protein LEN26_019763 [Aphanomyces euteiches]KAH9112197.1 hypothetical protein AeMF1_013433 [Aphanomyces euteiches]KAH9185498.1 hypothetical protein AeNC1_012529 [Aphanomyces euteiches]